jgi:ribosomal protein S18 acetylase RimI-like enzyme
MNDMSTSPTIRSATASDASMIAALGMQVWLHTYATDGISPLIADYVLAEFTAGKIGALLDDPDVALLVAEIGGNLVGFVLIRFGSESRQAKTSVEIERIYVQEHFHRRGIGTALMQGAQEESERRTGSRRVWLMVYIHNVDAIAFYLRHGFVRAGVGYFELGDERHENHLLVSEEP